MTAIPAKLPAAIWLSFDWAQAELYQLCLFSKDEALKAALLSTDVHRSVIAGMYGIDPETVTEERRNLSKIVSYALIYSGFDLDTTRAIVFRKANGSLTMQQIDEALALYQERFHKLFDWVNESLTSWFQSGGEVRYMLGSRKLVRYPDYQRADLDALRRSKPGRTAINTYGQNSVGLLLKKVYSHIWRNPVLRDNMLEHIPVFDAMSMLVRTEKLGEVLEHLQPLVTPLFRFDGFEIQMKADWKIGLRSWGELQKLDLPARSANPLVIEWERPTPAEATVPLIQRSEVNPFAEGSVNPFAL